MRKNHQIGGWLLLLALQLIVYPIYLLIIIKKYIGSFFSYDWANIKTLNDVNIILFRKLSYFEFAFYCVSFILCLVLIFYFFKTKQVFKNIYIVFMLFTIAGYTIAFFIADKIESLPESKTDQISGSAITALVWLMIWIIYLFKSKRSINTFVN